MKIKKSTDHKCKNYFWTLNSISQYLNYCSFVASLKLGSRRLLTLVIYSSFWREFCVFLPFLSRVHQFSFFSSYFFFFSPFLFSFLKYMSLHGFPYSQYVFEYVWSIDLVFFCFLVVFFGGGKVSSRG